mgnify:CR=1 FL=1
MNCIPSTQRKGRASLPLFYLLLAAALAPTLSFAQVAPAPAASPAPVAGVVAAVPLPGLSGSDQVGPVILRDETIAQVLDLMQRWTGKSILRPQALPASVYTLSLPASITRDEALHRQVLLTHMRLGLGVGANDIELVLRGLPSIELRYRAQDASTRALASWMQTQPGVIRVLHPALPGSPGHEAWARDARAAACLFSAVFDPAIPQQRIDAFCDGLRLFRLGWSWAGPVSLCAPYQMASLRSQGWPLAGGLVRFAVGLEAVGDLQADLAQAMPLLQA